MPRILLIEVFKQSAPGTPNCQIGGVYQRL